MPGAVVCIVRFVFNVLLGCGFGSGQSRAISTDEMEGTAVFEATTGTGTGTGVGSTIGSGVVGGAVDLPSSLAAQEPKTMQRAIAEI